MSSFSGVYRKPLKALKGKELTIFMHILMNCNHSDDPNYIFNNKVVPLKRGDWITSIPTLKKLTDYTDQQIRTALKNLTNLTYLLTDNLTNRGRKLTVVNIDNFLVKSKAVTDQLTDQLTDHQQTDNRPLTINKNVNNKKNVNNEKNLKTHTEKSVSKIEKPKKEKVDYTEQFNEFWNQYPRRIAKDAAFKAYESVIKNKKATHTEIMMGVMQYAQETQNTEPKFIKYPQGWLNAGRWKDPANSNTNSRAGYSTSAQPCKTTRTMQILAENNAKFESGELPMYGTGDEDIF